MLTTCRPHLLFNPFVVGFRPFLLASPSVCRRQSLLDVFNFSFFARPSPLDALLFLEKSNKKSFFLGKEPKTMLTTCRPHLVFSLFVVGFTRSRLFFRPFLVVTSLLDVLFLFILIPYYI